MLPPPDADDRRHTRRIPLLAAAALLVTADSVGTLMTWWFRCATGPSCLSTDRGSWRINYPCWLTSKDPHLTADERIERQGGGDSSPSQRWNHRVRNCGLPGYRP